MELLTCQDLTLAYGKHTVVEKLSFSLSQGQRVLVCGENGSGKSTLLRALVGLHAPEQGRIVFADGVARGIGYLPQKSAEAADFPASAFEVAALGLRRRGIFLSRAQKKEVLSALALFGAEAFSARPFAALSGGQRQRVLLARAYLSACRVLLLDEPVTGLDPKITHELYHTLRAVSRTGRALLFVSHDIHGALSFATHVLHLNAQAEARFYTVEEFTESAHFCALCQEVHHA